ncbi:hypothetical protein TNCV_1382181 [Trichonephila clavipes]|nr:hypothetical protein TNCV_1382181 [Trichonephila clavipes]
MYSGTSGTRANCEQSESQWQTGGVIKRHPRRVWLTAASGIRGTGNPIPFLQRSFGMDNGLQKGGHEEYSISDRANCSPGKSLFRTKEKEKKKKEELLGTGKRMPTENKHHGAQCVQLSLSSGDGKGPGRYTESRDI